MIFLISFVFNALHLAEKEPFDFIVEPEITVAPNLYYDPKIKSNEDRKVWIAFVKAEEAKQTNIYKKMRENIIEEIIDVARKDSGTFIDKKEIETQLLSLANSARQCNDHMNFLNFLKQVEKYKFNKLLLTYRAREEIDKATNNPNTEKIIMQLISEGADVSKIGKALPLAIARGFSPEYIQFLLENGADTNFFSNIGSPFLLALDAKNLNLIKALIKYNLDVNFLNPLFYNRSLLILTMLSWPRIQIEKEISSNRISRDLNIKLEIIKELLQAGADPSLKDIFGYNFIDYFGHNKPIADIIEQNFIDRRELIRKNTGLTQAVMSIIDSYL